ncbi:MAG TPA: hypothetical protein VGM76_08525 [Lacipirellulaceae bacterium]
MRLTNPVLVALFCLAWPQLVPLGLSTTASAEQSLYAPASSCEVMRSGDLACPSRGAIPPDNCHFSGYYVGGGAGPCPCLSCPLRSRSCERCRDQGTWGWDYVGGGGCVSPFVRLGWWCPPHYQGGPGNYAPDGPNFCHQLMSRYRTALQTD